MVVAAVLAGGVGMRLGENVPKQFIEVFGKPIIIYTLERLNSHPEIDQIIVACVSPYIEQLSKLSGQYELPKLKKIIPGGDTFQDSMKNCIKSLENICSDDDVLLMHMSISPMVSADVISDSIGVCKQYGNAFSAEPMYMCMCEKTGSNYSDKFLDRDVIFGLNTPQSFRFAALRDIYRKAEMDNFDINSEPHVSTLMLAYGKSLYFSKASPKNIKITTKDDLDLFKALLFVERQKTNEEEYQHHA